MTSDVAEGLKVPTRPAPPPPKIDSINGHIKRSTTFAPSVTKTLNEKRSDKYIYQSVPRSRSTSDIFGGKKKPPPPRPPPPKIPPITNVTNPLQKPQSIKIKLPGFKSRKKHQHSKPHVHISTWRATPNKSHPLVGSLIDLQSPAHSPGFSNRSSSDDSSVDSFDSDSGDPSSNENQNDYMNSWNNGSQVESGFEDDFDRISTPSSSDPWSDSKSDPFSPQRKSVLQSSGQFDISNDDPKARKLISFPSASNFRPTVIRPAIPIKNRKAPSSPSNDLIDGSPPMPTIPPPPPPPEAFEILANGPPIPPRPTKSFQLPDENVQKPYCIALYDYTGDHKEDLSFKEGEKVNLKRSVNEEWLEGEINGKIGIFPLCFVKIMVPLSQDKETDYNDSIMITLFDYHAQTWDDLDLKEGDLIKVIGKVDDNWLYGECNGKKGQFPITYAAEYLLD